MTDEVPARTLGYVASFRSRARSARHNFGFPVLVLGLVTAGAVPFYLLHPPGQSGSQALSTTPLAGSVGGYFLPHAGQWAAVYWLVALGVAYGATVAYYRARGRQLGLQGRVVPAAVLGAVLVVVLVASSPSMVVFLHLPSGTTYLHPGGDLAVRGLSPLLVVASVLLALAYLERSVSRAAFALVFLGVALLVNLYDVENTVATLTGAAVPAALTEVPNVALAAAYLLVGGVVFSRTERAC